MRIRWISRTVRTQQTENFAFLYLKRNIVDGGKVAVFFHNVRDLNRVRSVSRDLALAVEF